MSWHCWRTFPRSGLRAGRSALSSSSLMTRRCSWSSATTTVALTRSRPAGGGACLSCTTSRKPPNRQSYATTDPSARLFRYVFESDPTSGAQAVPCLFDALGPRLSGGIGLRICQRLRLDPEPLSFVAPTGPAEAHDHSISRAFGFRPPREQGITRRQKFEIIEANTAQARRAGSFHYQEIAGAAAPMTCPLGIQRLDHHQFRGAV